MPDISHSLPLEDESFIFPCVLCDFSDTEQRSLQNHIESIHMNVKQELSVKDENQKSSH